MLTQQRTVYTARDSVAMKSFELKIKYYQTKENLKNRQEISVDDFAW